MTAIIAFSHNKYPYIVSDLLLSGPEQLGKKCVVPTIDDVHEIFPRGSGWTVTGLTQKVVIIDNYIAIGFSGPFIAARAILTEIIDRSAVKKFDLESIAAFMDKEIPEFVKPGEVSVVGHIIDDIGLAHFGYSCSMLPSPHPVFGDVKYIGSGGGTLWKRIQHIENTLNVSKYKNLDTSYPILPLAALMELISEELVRPNPILHFYGGGWELVSLNSKGFTKLNDVTFIFWRITEDKNGSDISHPLVLLKYQYIGGLFGIRRIWFKNLKNDPPQVEDMLYIMGTPVQAVSASDKSKMGVPSVHSSIMVNVFLVVRNGKLALSKSCVLLGKDAKNLIEFVESDSGVTGFDINMELMKEIVEDIDRIKR